MYLSFLDTHRADGPALEPPEKTAPPRCPVCGEETDEFFLDYDGSICGCDNCVRPVDAWDYREEHDG